MDAAVRAALFAVGGPDQAPALVRLILSQGSGPIENARVVDVLQLADRLEVNTRGAKSGDPIDFQEFVTGRRSEWTGQITDPTFSYGHYRYRRDQQWVRQGREVARNLPRRERTRPREHVDQGAHRHPEAAEMFADRRIADEMTRQLQFARESNLRGIESGLLEPGAGRALPAYLPPACSIPVSRDAGRIHGDVTDAGESDSTSSRCCRRQSSRTGCSRCRCSR